MFVSLIFGIKLDTFPMIYQKNISNNKLFNCTHHITHSKNIHVYLGPQTKVISIIIIIIKQQKLNNGNRRREGEREKLKYRL